MTSPWARKLQIAVVFLVALLLVAAVGAYAWDSSRSDEIAEGVTIGGVDVGGMTADEATEAVDDELVEPLRKQVTVTYDGRQVPAQRREARGRLRRRRDGRPGARGEPGGRPADPRLALRHRRRGRRRDLAPGQLLRASAIDEFIAKVAAEVNREPVDASIEPTAVSLERRRRPGRASPSTRSTLRRGSSRSSSGPTTARSRCRSTTVEPEVTKDELAEQYPTYLTVDHSSFTSRCGRTSRPTTEYTVAVGQPAYPTPTGLYSIAEQGGRPGLERPELRLGRRPRRHGRPRRHRREPAQGALDGDLPTAPASTAPTTSARSARAASHGCVRMAVPDVIELYDQVPVGTPIYIG